MLKSWSGTLAPNEPNIDIEHIVGKQEVKDSKDYSRFSVGKEQMRQWSPVGMARWEEHQRMLIILEQKSQELCLAIEQVGERQTILAAWLLGTIFTSMCFWKLWI